MILLDIRDKTLLQMMGDVGGEDGLCTAKVAVRAENLDTIRPCRDKRAQDLLHAMVEEAVASKLARFVRETFQL